jgi:hypothetical protein
MAADSAPRYPAPQFTPEVVADQLRDGYWLEATDIDGDGRPDLMGFGLTLGEIYWYQNPDWTRRLMVNKIHMPVGGAFADITGNGRPDMVVSYELYGPGGTIHHPNAEGGKIDWLEHPGDATSPDRWIRHYVGNTVGMHRLRIGHFTQTERWEIMGFPVVAMEGVHGILPVVLFTEPDDLRDAKEWPMTVIDDTNYRMIHGVARKPGLIPGSDLDSILMASDEGVTWLWYDQAAGQWRTELIGTGERSRFEQTTFRGSGDVDGGRIGDDPLAYVAASEPYHGNTVAVYHRDQAGAWKRVLLDIFGDPNENGEGTGHSVLCADFDGDGDDEFLIGLRGPAPWQGVYYYKAIDLANGVFAKWKVGDESVARVVAGDFNGDGTLDFATIAYKVPHYYEARDAKLMLYRNQRLAQGPALA